MIDGYYEYDDSLFIRLDTQSKFYLLYAIRDYRTKEILYYKIGRKYIYKNTRLFDEITNINNKLMINNMEKQLQVAIEKMGV